MENVGDGVALTVTATADDVVEAVVLLYVVVTTHL